MARIINITRTSVPGSWPAALSLLRATLAVGVYLSLTAASAFGDGLGYDDAPKQELCGLCHGLSGVSQMPKFPKLAGQKAAYIEKQLRDFRQSRRTNDGGQMAAIVSEIDEGDIAEVAAYFSNQPSPEPAAPDGIAPDSLARGKALFQDGSSGRGIPACASCHSPHPSVGANIPVYAPLLSSQHESYLLKQLEDFRSQSRSNDVEGVMPVIAAALSDQEIEDIARYLSTTPRDEVQ